MTTAALIQRLTDTGIRLSVDGDCLHVEAAPGTVTAELRALLANRKADLLGALSGTRGHLLTLAKAEGMDAGLVHELPEADAVDLNGLPDSALVAFLHMRQDTADRTAGRIPARETAAMLCVHCGPVWASPAVTAVLPVVDGWPRALGCPWCHVRKALKAIPRPPVTCATCQHFQPDTLNPDAGMGECVDGHGDHYPNQRHRCGQYRPKENQP